MALDFMSWIPSAMDATIIFTQVMQIIVTLGIVAGIMLFLMKKKVFYRFPVEIEILKVLQGGKLQAYDSDKARRVKDKDGEEYYDVKSRNFKWYPPTFQAQLIKQGGKKVKIYVKELSHNNWEIIDPAKFVNGKPDDFKALQDESTIRFWKNVEDEKADIKWKKKDNWQFIKDYLGPIAIIIGLGVFIYLFGNHIAIPVLNTMSSVNTQSVQTLQKASELMERSTQYVELILKLNGVPLEAPWVNNTNASVIA